MNTYKKLVFIFTIVVFSLLTGCRDIIAKNIEGDIPVLLTPVALDTIPSSPIQIKWEPIDGATKYRIQIARPSFAAIEAYVMDSIVSDTDISVALDSNQYELKLTAMNAGYSSQTLGPIKFWVAKSPAPQLNSLQLSSPLNNAYLGYEFNGVFQWTAANNAIGYELELRKGNSFNSGQIIYSMSSENTLTKTIPFNLLPLNGGTYFWRVLALNASGAVVDSKISSFTVDLDIPVAAQLLTPANGTFLTLSDSIHFTWNAATNTGTNPSPITYLLEVSSTSSFTNPIWSKGAIGTTNTAAKLLGASSGSTYFWRVRAEDAAGNKSAFYDTLSFTFL